MPELYDLVLHYNLSNGKKHNQLLIQSLFQYDSLNIAAVDVPPIMKILLNHDQMLKVSNRLHYDKLNNQLIFLRHYGLD